MNANANEHASGSQALPSQPDFATNHDAQEAEESELFMKPTPLGVRLTGSLGLYPQITKEALFLKPAIMKN